MDEQQAKRPPASQAEPCRACIARATAIALLAALLAAPAHADGGTVRLNRASGPFLVTVLTAPTPLRAGIIDISVLVQDGRSRAPVLDAAVTITLHPADSPAPGGIVPATHAAATNKLLYSAVLGVSAGGPWSIDVAITAAAGSTSVSCTVDVESALAPVVRDWPYLALPFAVIALYAVQQWLRARFGD